MFRLSRGNIVLGVICTLDMVSTLYLYLGLRIVEANPIMAFLLNHGIAWFIAAKLLSYVPALYVLEWYRKRHPAYGRLMTRAAIGGYVAVYTLGLIGVNVL